MLSNTTASSNGPVSLQRSPDSDLDSVSDSDSLFGDSSKSVTLEDHSKPATPISTEAVDHQDDPVHGLQWTCKNDVFSLTPQWTVEPTIGAIVMTLQKAIDPHKQYNVEHLWDGTYNKIYSVSYDQTDFVMRVSLPVCPRTKIESEAATLQWVCENTNLPVPRVRSYDSSRNNPIGFEWILMDRIDGVPLSQCWSSTTQDAKERIVKQVAGYAATAFWAQFKGVGNLYPPQSHSPTSRPRGERASLRHYGIPFRTAFKWTKRRLRLISADLRLKTQEISDKHHRAIAARMLVLVDRLRNIEDMFFPTPEICSDKNLALDDNESTDEGEDIADKEGWPYEPTMLWHDDISLDNILVDKSGILCGIIGWECVSCLPLYEACQFPAFLQQSQDRPVEPLTPYGITQKQLDNNQHIANYDRNLRQHHTTLLRRLFITEMMDKCPEWVTIFDSRKYLRDYEAAVQNCDNEFAYEIVETWVDAVEKAESPDKTPWHLHERLMG
ncbi:kinase-like domain-containing protein [Annulohypoxylon truncatum]|uniref:kinase-like domain-containing protein n=1 Tax=Annulohypoxylon truncatum TaxID=327061 RepID=UPI002008702E|nr:kinase-like domain-containing protein [Annulohypoxylon truncatum]KAI1206105.1 kinase-like domain-containing protein [Annulohypoxylon truncatum]